MAPERKSIEQQLAQARAKVQQLEARAASRKRKTDDRRKILIGVTVIAAMEKDDELREKVRGLLDAHLTKPLDREVVAEWLPRT
ncbi:mobilization protein [Acidisoma cladoniae]|uniref:mobilization protein n=1 Tax=Acidisoma cladoniae TaxID=3040935 RepID=UPI0025515C29|nr:mobilization protein [Acidisoma sp. PAMC 29798]